MRNDYIRHNTEYEKKSYIGWHMEKQDIINLKLPKEIKRKFKETVHIEGYSSMQEVLAIFVRTFNLDPKKFIIKMELVEK